MYSPRYYVSHTHPMPFYSVCNPSSSIPYIRQDQGTVRVILQFNIPAILQKYPKLKIEEIKQHPYYKELKSKHATWINQLYQYIPNMNISHNYQLLTSGVAATLPREMVVKLKNFPFIKAIYPDTKIQVEDRMIAHHHSNISQVIDQNRHNLQIIGVLKLREAYPGLDGSGIRVAIIDLFFKSEGRGSHGWLMDSIIKNVAPRAQLLHYHPLSDSDLIAQLERAVLDKVNVINLSISPLDNSGAVAVVNLACISAVDVGITVVAASGNDGSSSRVHSIARSPRIICVGATNARGDEVASFSNYDSALHKPDIVAPGSYEFGGHIKSGTSVAAAYVSGCAALFKQAKLSISPKDIREYLYWTATRIIGRPPDAKASQGGGRINIYNAVSRRLDS